MRKKTIPAVPKRTVYEELATLSISYLDESASASLVQGDLVEGEFVADTSTIRFVDLGHDGFLELMAEKPDGKPKGEFRRQDVLSAIDSIESKKKGAKK